MLVAILGVFVIAYGDSWISGAAAPGEGNEEEKKDSTSRLAGDLLAFFGSISYAWYEVWYKMNGEGPDEFLLEDCWLTSLNSRPAGP